MSFRVGIWHAPAIAAACAIVIASVASVPAGAAITCVDNFQRVGAELIATPYCRDSYLVSVAQGMGSDVSAAQVRNNPRVRDELCHLVGVRAIGACDIDNGAGAPGGGGD